MNGNTTACVEHVRGVLEAMDYEMLVFHTTGVGGRTMEGLVADGMAAGCLDLTTVELAQEVVGGPYAAGPGQVQGGPAGGSADAAGPRVRGHDRLQGRAIR